MRDNKRTEASRPFLQWAHAYLPFLEWLLFFGGFFCGLNPTGAEGGLPLLSIVLWLLRGNNGNNPV